MATAATVGVAEADAVGVAAGVAAGFADPPQPASTANEITQSRRSIVGPILCAVRIAVTVAIASLVAGCGGHEADSAPPGAEGPQLVVVGDSLAAGRFADTQGEAFPEQVAAAVHANLELLGKPGATTAELAAFDMPGGGRDVVVEAGTNDVLQQTPPRRFANSYRALLAKVRVASPGAKLVCLTVWIGKGAPGKIPAATYNAKIRRACARGAVADISKLFDARPPTRGPAGRPTFLGPGDSFHPNSVGHAAIARAI